MAREDRQADLHRAGNAALHRGGEFLRPGAGEEPVERGDEGLDHLRRVAEVDPGEVLTQGDLIAKGGRKQMCVGIAADIAKQGLMIDVPALGQVKASRIGKPHCQYAAAQREVPRLTGGKVAGIGEYHQELGPPDRSRRHSILPAESRFRTRQASLPHSPGIHHRFGSARNGKVGRT